MSRYKVWARGLDSQPGTFLLRTGSSERRDQFDIQFTGTPRDVAIEARKRAGFVGVVLVKDFDTDRRWTVSTDGVVTEGWPE